MLYDDIDLVTLDQSGRLHLGVISLIAATHLKFTRANLSHKFYANKLKECRRFYKMGRFDVLTLPSTSILVIKMTTYTLEIF